MDNEHPSNNLNQDNSLALIDVIEEMTVDSDNLEDFLREEYDEEVYVDENINVEEQMDTNLNEDYYINSSGYFKYSETNTSDLNENSVSEELVNDKRSLNNQEESNNSDDISDSIGNEMDIDDLIYSITNSENNDLEYDTSQEIESQDQEYNLSQEIESQNQEYNTSHEMESPTNDKCLTLPNNCKEIIIVDSDEEDTSNGQLNQIARSTMVSDENLSSINYIKKPQNWIMFPGYNKTIFKEIINFISNKILHDTLHTSKEYGTTQIDDLLKLLLPNVWLNDLIIQQYINLLIKNCNYNDVLAFNTYFFEIVEKFGFNGYIERHLKGKNLLDYNKIIVPTHLDNNHWCLLIVKINKRKITYFDSLNFFDITLEKIKVLAGFLNEEYLQKRLKLKTRKKLSWNVYIGNSPKQWNSIDCGIFLCTNARYNVLKKPINFNHGDIPLIRQRMSYELINNILLPTI